MSMKICIDVSVVRTRGQRSWEVMTLPAVFPVSHADDVILVNQCEAVGDIQLVLGSLRAIRWNSKRQQNV